MSFDIGELLQQLGAGLIGAPNIGAGLGRGAQNYAQSQQYQGLLGKLFSQGNPVGTGTPTNNFVTADRSGMQPITQPGMLAGSANADQMKQLLGALPPDQGSPILSSLLMSKLSPTLNWHKADENAYDNQGNIVVKGAPDTFGKIGERRQTPEGTRIKIEEKQADGSWKLVGYAPRWEGRTGGTGTPGGGNHVNQNPFGITPPWKAFGGS